MSRYEPRVPIADRAKGKWPAILASLGLDKSFLSGKHGPCPICGGKDRFRFSNKDDRGTWHCTQCGTNDGVELVKRFMNLEFKGAVLEIEKHIGAAPVTVIRQGRSEREVRDEMNDIWGGGKSLGDVEATSLWWSRRTGQLPTSGELRAVRSLRCPGAADFPAMVARITAADGKPCNLHRTFLSPVGTKPDIPEHRRVMDISLPKGSAVRLSQPSGGVLGIAEGIETAEACRLLFGVPTWALLSAENMTGFVAPAGVGLLMVFGDNDVSFTGHWAAYTVARKHRMAKACEAEVCIPPAAGQDWNDVWQAKLRGENPNLPEVARALEVAA